MRVGECCNRDVVITPRTTGIVEATQLMRCYHVGTLMVVDAGDAINKPVGIVTDRDLVIEVLALDVPLDTVTLGDVMGDRLLSAAEDDDLLRTVERMRTQGVRRMPVVGTGGALRGILSFDDVVALLGGMVTDLARLVDRQIGLEAHQRG